MKTRVLLSHRARRIFFFIHLWAGLILGAWFALIGITGSVLTWRGELGGIEMAQRYPLQKPSVNADMISLSQAVAAMQKTNPDTSESELSLVTVPNNKMPFYTFSRGKSPATETVAVDPYSAQVHPPVQMSQFFGAKVQLFHQRLFLGAKGFVANGFLTTLAIFLLLSGLWLWWPIKLEHLKAHLVIKRGVSLKRTLHDLHNVLGIYLYAVLLVTTVSGAMMAFQRIGNQGGMAAFLSEGQAPPSKSASAKKTVEKKGITVTPEDERIGSDELVALARKEYPHYELRNVKLPTRPEQPLESNYARPFGFEQEIKVFFNPYTGQEIEPAPGQVEPRRTVARQWAHDLHLGEFGGVLSKLIYTISGLLPLGLFTTGFLLWWRKKRAKSKKLRR